jgi:isopenicillin N synthase-like dioxygenase
MAASGVRRTYLHQAATTTVECALNMAIACGPHLLQVGESMQIHSGGLLRATPHFVRSASSPAATNVSRNTFAVFMQPR